jgi:hypothetical protein
LRDERVDPRPGRSAGLALIETHASPSGVIIAKYRRAGAVKSGALPSAGPR